MALFINGKEIDYVFWNNHHLSKINWDNNKNIYEKNESRVYNILPSPINMWLFLDSRPKPQWKTETFSLLGLEEGTEIYIKGKIKEGYAWHNFDSGTFKIPWTGYLYYERDARIKIECKQNSIIITLWSNYDSLELKITEVNQFQA